MGGLNAGGIPSPDYSLLVVEFFTNTQQNELLSAPGSYMDKKHDLGTLIIRIVILSFNIVAH